MKTVWDDIDYEAQAGKSRKPKVKTAAGTCKKCGKSHADGCFNIDQAVKRQFAKEFAKFMED